MFSRPPSASVTIAVTSSSLILLRSPIVAYSPVAGVVTLPSASNSAGVPTMSETIESTSSSLRFSKPLIASATILFTSSTLMSFNASIDVPKLSNTEPLDIMSRMEMVLLDIGGYFNWGPPSDNQTEGFDLTFSSIIPTLEAFNDRAYGWVDNITVDTKGTYDYCDYPSGSYV